MTLCLTPTSSAQEVTISIDAPSTTGTETDFVVRVDITDVTNFDACNYDITYDPSVIEVTGVTAGLIGDSAVPIDMWGEIVPGKLRIIENIPGAPGVSGSGYLAEIHFRVIGDSYDTGGITISNVTLSDNTATEIQATRIQDS